MAFNYTLNWSNDALKSPFTLPSGTVDTSTTSLSLTGKAVPNWGEHVQENLIRLLEHFASNTPPQNPTIGQLWYDSGNSKLMLRTVSNTWAIVYPQEVTTPTPTPTPTPTTTPTPTPTGTGTPTPTPTPTTTPAPGTFTATAVTSISSPGNLTHGSALSSYIVVTTNVTLSSATLIAGTLPVGTSLTVSGTDAVLNGTPTADGTYTGTIRVSHGTSSVPSFLDRTFYLVVTTPVVYFAMDDSGAGFDFGIFAAPTTSTPTPTPTPTPTTTPSPTPLFAMSPDNIVEVINWHITITNQVIASSSIGGPLTFSVLSGVLPPGITLNTSAGGDLRMSGYPHVIDIFDCVCRVTHTSTGQYVDLPISIEVI